MKKKKIIRYICFLLILTLLVQCATSFLKTIDTNTIVSMRGYANEYPNDIDVLFLGQSEVYTGFIPTRAYEKFGYSSFAYGLSAMPSTIFPAVLDQTTKNQNPKVLVVEITAFSKKDKYYNKTAELHSFIDNMPIGKDRFDIIRNYIPKERQIEFYRPVSTYHGNWKLPSACFRSTYVRFMTTTHKRNVLKGFSTSAFKANMKHVKKDKHFGFEKKSEESLNAFIAACKDKGYDNVLFVRFPHARKISDKKSLKRIKQTIKDAGYDFLDLNNANKKIGIDLKKDYYSTDHLNLYGAKKHTDYLGQYIKEHYDLPAHTDSEFLERWDSYTRDANEILDFGEKLMKKNDKTRIYEYSIPMSKLEDSIPFL